MRAYAGLVEDEVLRARFLGPILEEYAATRSVLEELQCGALEAQRPTLTRSIEMRSPAMRSNEAWMRFVSACSPTR